jgi:hypothetical protein
MMPLPDGADFRKLRAWRNAEELAAQLQHIVDDLVLSQDREWLRYVLGEALSQLRGSLGFAQTVPEPARGTRPNFEAFTIAASAARTSIAFLDYALAFMRSEQLIGDALGLALHARLQEVEGELVAVVSDLREANIAYRAGLA